MDKGRNPQAEAPKESPNPNPESTRVGRLTGSERGRSPTAAAWVLARCFEKKLRVVPASQTLRPEDRARSETVLMPSNFLEGSGDCHEDG
jgi:hypothetical protein